MTGELETIAERLADQALDRLRQAADNPEDRDRLLAEERRITRARRSVEKAALLLRGGQADGFGTVEP